MDTVRKSVRHQAEAGRIMTEVYPKMLVPKGHDVACGGIVARLIRLKVKVFFYCTDAQKSPTPSCSSWVNRP
jgi:hypothetical protein